MDGWQIGLRQWIHYLSIWILVMLGIRDPIEVRVSFMRLSTILSKLSIIIFFNPPTVLLFRRLHLRSLRAVPSAIQNIILTHSLILDQQTSYG